MFDYDAIKTLAKSIKRPVTDLLALAQQNDPFYVGTPSRKRDAEWFAATVWGQHGGPGSHLRRIHYVLISSAMPIIKPDGTAYENTEADWQYLIRSSLSARYLNSIPFDSFVDRRNDEPMFFANDLEADPDRKLAADCDVYIDEPVVSLSIPGMPSLPHLSLDIDRPTQKFIAEVWIEKSTQNDWLLPLCRRRGINLCVGAGEQSETRARELALRAAQYGAPVRIVYIADFDPAGRSIPKAASRKLEFSIAKFGLDVDLQLIPLALTPEQCRHYNLPRTPIKEADRRKDTFEKTFGVGATELDALEGPYPGELARLLNAEIDNWIDSSLSSRAHRLRSELLVEIAMAEHDVRSAYAEQIAAVGADFDTIVAGFQEVASRLDGWRERASRLWQILADEMRDRSPDPSEVEIPRSQAPGKTDRFALFDSRRDYLTQMDAYNAWRDGAEPDGEVRQ